MPAAMNGWTGRDFRIFSFDGGGIRGLFQACFLERAQQLNPLLRSEACLYAGTSTGAIVATGLALGKSPCEMVEIYRELGPALFGKRRSLWKRCRGEPAYSSEKLREFLEQHFDKRRFGECKPQTLATAVSLLDYRLKVFDSADFTDAERSVVDVLLSTSAAPTFFRPHTFDSREWYLDGGLACNNPAAESLRVAKKFVEPSQVWIMSVGTCCQPMTNVPSRFIHKTKLGWARPVIEACMESSTRLVDRTCKELLDDQRYLTINPKLDVEIQLDDVNLAMQRLPRLAVTTAEERDDEIKKWLSGNP